MKAISASWITTDTLEDSADLSGFIERLPISSLIALAAGSACFCYFRICTFLLSSAAVLLKKACCPEGSSP